MFGKMSRMKSSELYRYTAYFGTGATAIVLINEFTKIVDTNPQINCLYCLPSLVGCLLFYAIVSNARWMSRK